VESGYLTLVKTNLGFTHQGIVRLWLVGRLYAPVRANSGKMTLRLEGRFFYPVVLAIVRNSYIY